MAGLSGTKKNGDGAGGEPRTAEDNTYLQVDMQANIFRSRTHHFVQMHVWKMVKAMVFTCTTTTRASWMMQWDMSHLHTRRGQCIQSNCVCSAQRMHDE